MRGAFKDEGRTVIPTIGVVSPCLARDPYERGVVAGIVDAVQLRGGRVVCFAVEGIMGDFDAFIGMGNVDGFVVLSGPIVHFAGKQSLESFCERRRHRPLVTVALELSGFPRVGIDNPGGLRKIVSHLVDVHGRRRIAFIRGPDTSASIRGRYVGYCQGLAEHGIELDEARIFSSSVLDGGAEAIRVLFDERKQAIDAVVAFNDASALSALTALIERGVRVPQDVAVVGFHDVPEAAHVVPALTTIAQKLHEQGWRAANLVLDALEGKEIPSEVVLETELIVRRSCGCFPRSIGEARSSVRPWPQRSGTEIDDPTPDIVAEMTRVLGPSHARSNVERLMAAFSRDLEEGSAVHFLSTLDEQLTRMARSGADLSPWDTALSSMRRLALPFVDANRDVRSLAEDLFQQARVLIGDTAQRAQAFQRVLDTQRADTLGSISRSLIAARDIQELAVVLASGLPGLEVNSCYLSLYDRRDSREWSTLVLGIDDEGRIAGQIGASFLTSRLVPDGVFAEDRAYTLVAMPLSFQNEQLGVIVLEAHPGHFTAYDKLREQFGAAFKRMEGERELARLHAAQRERMEELERAHQALRENQEKLLISQRMASLGRLTAGMAHEMNTPLAAVRAALDELLKLVSEYRSSIEAQDVTPQDHYEIAAEMEASTRLADSAAQRVADFVRGIKAETRDLASSEFRDFNPVPVIQETLLLLNHAARVAQCTLSLKPEHDTMNLYGSPSRLAQIVTNLVTNAIDASAEKGGGPIVLRLNEWEKGIELRVSDEGTGITPENIGKIFDPMYTSKPFGVGTGLGLTIVRDIVTGDFNGTIDVDSQVGRGTSFVLRFQNPTPIEAETLVTGR